MKSFVRRHSRALMFVSLGLLMHGSKAGLLDCRTPLSGSDPASAICSRPIPTPNYPDQIHDADQWIYKDCNWQSSSSEYWCKALGGHYDSRGVCVGLPATNLGEYFGPTLFSTKPAADSAIPLHLGTVWPGTSGLYSVCGIAPTYDGKEFGDYLPNGPCLAKPTKFVSGIETESARTVRYHITFTYKGDPVPCTREADSTYDQLRTRTLRCPLGDSLRTLANGDIECYHVPVEGPVCGVQHSVVPASGAERIHEVDAQFGSISIGRVFNSFSSVGPDPTPAGTPIWHSHTAQWHSTFERRLVAISGGMLAVRPDGEPIVFDGNGRPLVARRNADERVLPESTEPGAAWRFINSDDSVEYYDANGRFFKWASKSGSSYVLTYAAGLLGPQSATDERGRVVGFGYDSDRRLTSVVAAGATLVQYSYDGLQRLSTVRYGDGSGLKYHYENASFPDLVTGVSNLQDAADVTGVRYVTYNYDSSGRMVDEWLAPGVANNSIDRLHLDYSQLGSGAVTITTPLGRTVTQNLNTIAGAIRVTGASANEPMCGATDKRRDYGSDGRLIATTDFKDTQTGRTIDNRGLETQRIEAASVPGNPNPSQKRTIDTTWHLGFRVPTKRTVKNVNGVIEAMSTWAYNGRGQVTAECQHDPAVSAALNYLCGSLANAPLGVRQTTTQYCESSDVATPGSTCPILGLVKSVDGARTDVSDITTYQYYPSTDSTGCATGGTCHAKGDLWVVTNALGQTSTTLNYDAAGRPTRTQDANGTITDMTYNPRGWLLSRSIRANADGSASSGDATTTMTYDGTGQVTRVTQPDGAYSQYTYDNAHRLTDISDNLGNSMHYTLDAAGNRTKIDTKDPSGALKRTLSNVYDSLGQLYQVKNAATDTMVTHLYDPNRQLKTATDAKNVATENTYDPLNRLILAIQDSGAGSNNINARVGYVYDTRNNLRQVTDPSGYTSAGVATGNFNTTYTYDGLNNLTQLNSPDTGITSYTYDAAGNRTTQTDARGVTTSFVYDALNRLTSTTYPTTSLNVSYLYDEPDSVTGCSGSTPIGRATRMTSSVGTTTYCYDRRGNVVRKTQVHGNVSSQAVAYSYSLADKLTHVIYPSGMYVKYGRDAAGRITSVSYKIPGEPLTPLVTNVGYLPFGPVGSITYAGGVVQTRAYDQNYWVDSINSSAPDGLRLDFTEDMLGNITGSAPTVPGVPTEIYDYDHLYRLTGVHTAANANIESYTYNGTGDRLSKTVGTAASVPYSYANNSHRLSTVGGVSRGYDANGNLLSIGSTGANLAYDDRNRPAAVGNVAYDYNGRGERVLKTDESGESDFLYDEAGRLIAELHPGTASCTGLICTDVLTPDISGSVEYVWMDGLPVAVSFDGFVYNIEADHLGTPRKLRDPARNVTVWSSPFQGNPFGEAAVDEDPDGDLSPIQFNLRFPGQYADAESGFNYNYFRDYEPGTGRYVESDPIGLGGDISTYGYVSGDPLSSVDSQGLVKWKGSFAYATLTLGRKFGRQKISIGSRTQLNINVESECVDGYKTTARVSASSWELGLGRGGLRVSDVLVGEIELSDNMPTPDAKNLEGPLIFKTNGGLGTVVGTATAGYATGRFKAPLASAGKVDFAGSGTLSPFSGILEPCTCNVGQQ